MRIYAIPPVMMRRSCGACLRRAGSMLLVVTVWSTFFIWGVTMTQTWLDALAIYLASAQIDPWQAALARFLQTDAGVFLPASLLVFVSLALFFYRVPRVRGRLGVPIEFALTTLLFVGANLAAMQLLHFLAALLTALSDRPVETVMTTPITQSLIFTEFSMVITLAMLALLFWLQWTGRLLIMWRRWQRNAGVR